MNVNIGKGLNEAPWFASYMDTEVINLTTEMTNYTFNFTEDNEDYSDGKIVFELGTIN